MWVRSSSQTSTLRSEVASPIERGKTYRIRAERIGNHLRVVVNDRELFSVADPDPLSGSDRTIVGIFGWLAESIITRVKISTLGPVRAYLIKKGMVYSPSHGDMAFTVPLFDEFMRRAIAHFEP